LPKIIISEENMRLPDTVYQQLKTTMAHHAPWHFARFRREWVAPDDRPAWQLARNQFPNVKYLNQAGCGEEFLRFHRLMIRHFKWIVDQNPQSGFVYSPWRELPNWLAARFSENYLRVANARIAALIERGSADQLGNFIEATALDNSYGSSIHNSCHGQISEYEEENFPNDPRLTDASMNSPDTAHHNEHFWGLHGWIDEIFAAWQRRRGEEVDQSPLEPSHHDHFHMFNIDAAENGFVVTEGLRKLAREILVQ
jgi:hypothetical protein